MSRRPIYCAKSKGVEIAVWEGRTGPQFTINKRYKDKATDEWKDSKTYFDSDLEVLAELIQEALSWGKNVENIQEPAHYAAAGATTVDLDEDDLDLPFQQTKEAT